MPLRHRGFRDPHIDGDLISYTDEEPSSQIRQFDLATDTSTALARSSSDFDFLSDTNAGRTTWTRATSDRSAIMLTHPDGAVELDPQAGSRRRGSALGGGTVAWQDFGLSPTLGAAEIVAYEDQYTYGWKPRASGRGPVDSSCSS